MILRDDDEDDDDDDDDDDGDDDEGDDDDDDDDEDDGGDDDNDDDSDDDGNDDNGDWLIDYHYLSHFWQYTLMVIKTTNAWVKRIQHNQVLLEHIRVDRYS